jgi:hypothetical protein
MHQTIREIHGLGCEMKTVHEYCPQAVPIIMEGFYCKDGADICKHFSFWRFPHAEHVMIACKYCNLWCKCVEQIFIEHHLFEQISRFWSVQMWAKPFTYITFFNIHQFRDYTTDHEFSNLWEHVSMKSEHTLKAMEKSTRRVISLRSHDIISNVPPGDRLHNIMC